jgi:hypothetical protein
MECDFFEAMTVAEQQGTPKAQLEAELVSKPNIIRTPNSQFEVASLAIKERFPEHDRVCTDIRCLDNVGGRSVSRSGCCCWVFS